MLSPKIPMATIWSKIQGGVRKVRVAGRGKGKSGGYRIITVYISKDIPVYLLAMLSKGERANFSDAGKKVFRQLTAEIKSKWKEQKMAKRKGGGACHVGP